ncbi:alpha/beta fold hydrolase [Protaetiibacter mangrovi]|uniref:Alpha/beta hydrolase n=1 Tax=Protaetiibacter mangrovi TaxID=2970926 RepID=A0ABT1ZC50_9MICO|nr:alpha/beta hydrolase [Protaetiibacter mangrovi]MCS0498280.1 alpha/beta hydrolase [Protaetiibacter mangrovi]TPX03219.1 alpha/beta hydrolase [Schumannella luteola]
MSVPTPHAEALARIPVEERELEILGSRTRFWDFGPADARDVVVLAHGYRGDHHGLEPVIAQLDGVRIISPDLPGFGDSTALSEAPHSIAGYGRWLAAFIEALELPTPPVVLGHSFGSMVASHAIAEGMPARALILVNPITTDPKIAAGRGITAATRAFYGVTRAMPEGLARVWLGNWVIVQFMSMNLVKTPDRELRTWIHEEHHRYFNGFSDARTVAEAFGASVSTDVRAAAPRVEVPTVLIAGELDRIAPLAGQRTAVDLFPDARLVVVPGTGHLAHYETPALVAEAIRAFLAQLPAPAGPR